MARNPADGSPRVPLHVLQVGMGIGLVSISVFFAAMIIAFAMRIAAEPAPRRVAVPSVLYISTGVLIFSSVLLEAARYVLRRARTGPYQILLLLAAAHGVAFLGLQLFSWRELMAQQVFVVRNPQGSAFYVFSGIHGLHLLLGLGILTYLVNRSRELDPASESRLRRHRISLGVAAWYWHFMGALWLVLFVFLSAWARRQ